VDAENVGSSDMTVLIEGNRFSLISNEDMTSNVEGILIDNLGANMTASIIGNQLSLLTGNNEIRGVFILNEGTNVITSVIGNQISDVTGGNFSTSILNGILLDNLSGNGNLTGSVIGNQLFNFSNTSPSMASDCTGINIIQRTNGNSLTTSVVGNQLFNFSGNGSDAISLENDGNSYVISVIDNRCSNFTGLINQANGVAINNVGASYEASVINNLFSNFSNAGVDSSTTAIGLNNFGTSMTASVIGNLSSNFSATDPTGLVWGVLAQNSGIMALDVEFNQFSDILGPPGSSWGILVQSFGTNLTASIIENTLVDRPSLPSTGIEVDNFGLSACVDLSGNLMTPTPILLTNPGGGTFTLDLSGKENHPAPQTVGSTINPGSCP
jgi:hypothetical protein